MKVFIKDAAGIFVPATFLDCIFCQLKMNDSLQFEVYYCYEQNKLKLSIEPMDQFSKCTLNHPSFCPMLKLKEGEINTIPLNVIERGVSVGVVVLLESSDGKIIMTRRASHMRTFPNSWVPPGGHVEPNETMLNAGLRELYEETGLQINTELIQEASVLGMFESVFPPLIDLGLPSRHHIVTYFHILLHKSLKDVSVNVKLNKNEVDLAVWLSENNIRELLNTDAELAQEDMLIHYIDEEGDQFEDFLAFDDLKNVARNIFPNKERITTGTRYILSLWLSKKEKDRTPSSKL